MIIRFFNKTFSVFLTLIFIIGLFPSSVFAQPVSASSLTEIKGYNKPVFDNQFSRADREISPERWLEEARFGLTQAIASWELIADNFYTDPSLLKEAKFNIEKWSNEELEKRFTQWLSARFFGEAAEKAIFNLSKNMEETQKNYTWHLDNDGNIIFDNSTGDPLVIRPDDESRKFSDDLFNWKNKANEHVNNIVLQLYPELLSYIPAESLASMSNIIKETAYKKTNSIKIEFENIAAREERIFTTNRTRDIWSLRNKKENESARLFTEKLILETENSCNTGIKELNQRIEQAQAGTGDMALIGEEWLSLYREQFERGLKAWENAEEKFFIRRIEWEQESSNLFSEGSEIWLSAFNQLEEERKKWEEDAEKLFQSGLKVFGKISEDLNNAIIGAKAEFELNMNMRIGEGTARVKALVDMYLVYSSAAVSAKENYQFWKEAGNEEEMIKADRLHKQYFDNAAEVRNNIAANYAELMGSGGLKDILSENVSSEDFCLDEYQIALIKAKALVLYWERKKEIAEAVTEYANELSAGRKTEAEGLRAWENAKSEYNDSILIYEAELKKLNDINIDIKVQQEHLNKLTLDLQKEEVKLNRLNTDYTTLLSSSLINLSDSYLKTYINNYNSLVEDYDDFFETGGSSLYKEAFYFGMLWGIAEQKEIAEEILYILENINEEDEFSEELTLNYQAAYNYYSTFSQIEMMENINNSLSLLFDYYEIELNDNYLPDIQSIFMAILSDPENIIVNALSFFMDFSSCFEFVPQWIAEETNNWIFSFLDYINIYCYDLKENEKHWRQYINDDYISNMHPDLVNVSAFKDGLLADAMLKVVFNTNRLNDLFEFLRQNDTVNVKENSEYYFSLYSNYSNAVNSKFKSLEYKFNSISDSARAYELSKLLPEDIEEKLKIYKEDIDKQNTAYNIVKNKYVEEADKFLKIGLLYDNQYKVLNEAYKKSDQMRFEYEKQDAVKRWASTSYLNSDIINSAECNEKLTRARIVLNVLEDLYKNEDKRLNNDPVYIELYTAYEQNLKRKFNIIETYETVLTSIDLEYNNNMQLLSAYKESLYSLTSITTYDQESKSLKIIDPIKNIVTLKDGKLAFVGDDAKAVSLNNYLNGSDDISDFENALIELSKKMNDYFTDPEKFMQWSYAREYLLTAKVNDGEFKSLKNFISGKDEMKEDGSLGRANIKHNNLDKVQSLYSRLNSEQIYNSEDLFFSIWDALSDEEKADLEFYTILTLTENNDYFKGFSQYYTMDLYNFAFNYVNGRHNEAKRYYKNPMAFTIGWLWKDMYEINGTTLNNMRGIVDETNNSVNQWISGLKNNLNTISENASAYIASCEKLEALGYSGKNDKIIGWKEISTSLLATKNLDLKEISEFKKSWELMQDEFNLNVYSVIEALHLLLEWVNDKEAKSKINLQKTWTENINSQKQNEKDFMEIINNYINGAADIKNLKEAAQKAYGVNSSAWKNHFNNMQTVIFDYFSMYHDININYYSENKYEFYNLGNELVLLTEKTLQSRYMAEYAAREIEWNQKLEDTYKKLEEWEKSAELILENGRIDWIVSKEKMKQSFKRWIENFQNEYDRINSEWSDAYLAGLEDKERWLDQAHNAFNEASSEAMLSLLGIESERLSRFTDTREPLGIRGAAPEADLIMAELLQSSGIVNMFSAFSSINDITSASSIHVKQGMGGIAVWDSSLKKAASSELAREKNLEIANNETKKLAYNARTTADKAVKRLADNVDTANKNFRESMDDTFIMRGLWRRSGENYSKEIIKGSTIITPVVTQKVTVTGYKDYIMEPVTLNTNLHEINFETLDSIAIEILLDNVYKELDVIVENIFGTEEKKGKFGIYIGESPELKPSEEMKKERNSMFRHEGEGEQGRLLSDFYYWSILDAIGNSELGLAPWDKRIWNDDGCFIKAPSVRLAGTIVGSVVAGIFTCGAGLAGAAIAVAIGSATEIAFGSLDIAFGYKEFGEAAFNMGKAILTSAVSCFGGAGIEILSSSINIANAGLNSLVKGAISAAGSYSTSVAASYIDALSFKNGNFNYDHKAANSSWFDVNTIANAASAGVSAGSSSFLKNPKVISLPDQKYFGGALKLASSFSGEIAKYGIHTAFNLGSGMGLENSLIKAYDDMGGLTLNIASFGSILDFAYSTIARNNSTGQIAGDILNKVGNTGFFEINIGSNGVTAQFGTGGIDLGGALYDLSKRGLDFMRMSGIEDQDVKNTVLKTYGWGDWTAENTAVRIAKGVDDLLFDKNINDGYGLTTASSGKKGRIITIKDSGDIKMNAVSLQHEAYRDGIIKDDNYLETRRAVLAHTQMARNMMDINEIMANPDLLNDVYAYTFMNRDNFNAYVDANYDSSEDFWKLVRGEDGKGRFEWDYQYTFDLSEIGINERVNTLSNYALWDMYQLGSNYESFNTFVAAVENFYLLNNVMKSFESALDVEPEKTITNSDFNNHWTLFIAALQNVGNTGLIAETTASVLNINGKNVFANGGGALTCDYGWRAITWGDLANTFQWHGAWDLGVRGDDKLVAPMDGTLAFTFTQGHGIRLVTSGGENESITYSHSNASSIKRFVELYSTNGITMNDRGELQGIRQNMIIGTTGNTGTLSAGAHVDLIYSKNGFVQDPALYFNKSSYPSTSYAIYMSGLSSSYSNFQLNTSKINGIYDYLTSLNSSTATSNFMMFASKSNNYSDFNKIKFTRQRISQ